MSTIADAVDSIVVALLGAGVPATADPAVFGPLVAQEGAAALVAPPTMADATLDGALSVTCPVYVACPAPGSLADFQKLWPAIVVAAEAITHRGDMAPSSVQAGDQALPCYTLSARRRITP